MGNIAPRNVLNATITFASTSKIAVMALMTAETIRMRNRKNALTSVAGVIDSSATIVAVFCVGRFATATTTARTVQTRTTSHCALNVPNLVIPTSSSLAPIAIACQRNLSAICRMTVRTNLTREVATLPALALIPATADANTGART